MDNMSFDMKMKVKKTQLLIAARGLEVGGKTQKFIDSEVLLQSSPYVPFRKGVLEGSGTRHTNIGSGKVIYKTPYARRMYYNPQYNFQGAPMRGAYWFERMKADKLRTILDGAAKVAGGKGEVK